MSNFLGAVVVPHPPIIIPEIGKGNEQESQKTIEGLQKIARKIKELQPEVIVCITPHGNVFADGICVLDAEKLKGSFRNFGMASLQISKNVHQEMLYELRTSFQEHDVPSIFMDQELAEEYGASLELDHGCLVPLYYIDQQYSNYEMIHISIGKIGYRELYNIGTVIRKGIDNCEARTLIMASGDLSHTLLASGPYGYEPEGPELDKHIVEAFESGKLEQLFAIPEKVINPAATCAMESMIMALGAFDGRQIVTAVESYEGPFGVGYMNATMMETGMQASSLLEKIDIGMQERFATQRQQEDDYIQLARASMEQWIRNRKTLNWSEYQQKIQKDEVRVRLQQERAGTFVSIHKQGQLRGCIGTIEPTSESLAQEIIRNAIAASTEDPRFPSIRQQELDELVVKVDILHEPELISDLQQLDVKKYGVIVESGRKRGLLLPNLEGVDTVNDQVAIAMDKAGIAKGDAITLYRFEVERHEV